MTKYQELLMYASLNIQSCLFKHDCLYSEGRMCETAARCPTQYKDIIIEQMSMSEGQQIIVTTRVNIKSGLSYA